MNLLTQWIIPFVVVLGVLIFVHELGHFLVAKRAGVGVLKFSLGFGPKLVGIKRGETEYLISALPLGGYVKMIGEDPGDTSPEAADPQRSFAQKGVGARSLVILAGPLMNLILPVLLFSGIYMTVGQEYILPVVSRPDPNSLAAEAGLAPRDRILTVNGTAVTKWDDVVSLVGLAGREPVVLTVQRGEKTFEARMVPRVDQPLSGYGLIPFVSTRVAGVVSGSRAHKAGIQANDLIVAIEGTPVADWLEMSALIRARPEKATVLTVERQGKRFDVQVTPERDESGIGVLGIKSGERETRLERLNPLQAIVTGVDQTIKTSVFLVEVLWRILVRKISLHALGGPLMIAQATGEVAQQGLMKLIEFTALLSINLAILNLLPIPVLDGGHLLFSLIEWLQGKPVSLRKREIAQQVGLVLLIGLMVYVTRNDIFRWLGWL